MKVIAQRGKNQYLIAESVNSEMGKVLDIEQGKVFPEEPIASIVKGGYWENATMSKEELDKLLAGVKAEVR